MKRKEIIQLLLIAVVTMMFTACAASRRAVSDNHQEVKDSVSAIQQDSVHQQVMVNDSVAIKVSEDKHTSSSSTETGEYEETIQEQITETTIPPAKQKTTHRTTHRKGSYNNQSSYDERLQMQQQKINQMQKTIDSLAVSSRNDVGTHWEATDSLLATEEENTAETRKANWIQKARKNALALFLLIVIVLVLTAINKYTDHGEGKK